MRSQLSRSNFADFNILAGIALSAYGASALKGGSGWLVAGIGLASYGYLLGRE